MTWKVMATAGAATSSEVMAQVRAARFDRECFHADQ